MTVLRSGSMKPPCSTASPALLPYCLASLHRKPDEFWSRVGKAIFLSATPGKFEIELSNPDRQRLQPRPSSPVPPPDRVGQSTAPANSDGPHSPASEAARRDASGGDRGGVESESGWDLIGDLVDAQAVIRPTGITDPPVDIRPSEGQIADLVQECRARGQRGERVLVTALTKRMAGEQIRVVEWMFDATPCVTGHFMAIRFKRSSS